MSITDTERRDCPHGFHLGVVCPVCGVPPDSLLARLEEMLQAAINNSNEAWSVNRDEPSAAQYYSDISEADAAALRRVINMIKEEKDAIQIKETESMDVFPEARNGKEMGQEDSQRKETTHPCKEEKEVTQ